MARAVASTGSRMASPRRVPRESRDESCTVSAGGRCEILEGRGREQTRLRARGTGDTGRIRSKGAVIPRDGSRLEQNRVHLGLENASTLGLFGAGQSFWEAQLDRLPELLPCNWEPGPPLGNHIIMPPMPQAQRRTPLTPYLDLADRRGRRTGSMYFAGRILTYSGTEGLCCGRIPYRPAAVRTSATQVAMTASEQVPLNEASTIALISSSISSRLVGRAVVSVLHTSS